jgi:dsRNA-specific ribonuclease
MSKQQTEKVLLQDGDINKSDEQLIFNPYNEKNKEITEQQIQHILRTYGVPDKIFNINLYRRAFVHQSYVKRPILENEMNDVIIADKPHNCMKLRTKSNERLEFLGDGILEAVTKYYLYKRFPKANEGFMTEKKIALVKNESIGKMVYDMGLNNWYIISANAEEKKTRTNLKKLGCLFEAFIGALFLDFNKISIKDEDKWFDSLFTTGPGFQMAQIFIENVFEKHVNWMELIAKDDNYKNILQVLLQKAFKTTPIYAELSEVDEAEGYHMGVFLCLNWGNKHIDVNGDIYGEEPLTLADFKNMQKSNVLMSSDTILNSIKFWWDKKERDSEDNPIESYMIFLGDSKHKIKKKAEQEACRIAIDILVN